VKSVVCAIFLIHYTMLWVTIKLLFSLWNLLFLTCEVLDSNFLVKRISSPKISLQFHVCCVLS
jgi:hypothetical protein